MRTPTRLATLLLTAGLTLGALTAVRPTAARVVGSAPVFPLNVSPDRHHLLDATGTPLFGVGDSAWELAQASDAQIDTYLTDRAARGFTAVLFQAVPYPSSATATDGVGNRPFVGTPFASAPTDAYWTRISGIVGKIEARGMVAYVNVDYAGNNINPSDGWWVYEKNAGATWMQSFGTYVATTLGGHANVVWQHGTDLCPTSGTLPVATARADAVAIAMALPGALQTWQGSRGLNGDVCWGGPTTEPWLTVNTTYLLDRAVEPALDAWTAGVPFIQTEGTYERTYDSSTVPYLRHEMWQGALSGAQIVMYGNDCIWQLCGSWLTPAELGSAGGQQAIVLQSWMRAIAWERLVPDTGNTFLTGGIGTTASRAAAAITATGDLAAMYVPASRSVTVNLARMGTGSVTATFYNPATGAIVATSSLTGGGSMSVPAPSGLPDWAVVLTANGTPPPTTTTTVAPTSTTSTIPPSTTVAATTTVPATTTSTIPVTTTTVGCQQVVRIRNGNGSWVTRYIDQPITYCAGAHT